MLSAPTSTAPAARSRATAAASRVAGGWSALIFDPARVASPATSNRFLAANGTPASGPGSSPAARRRSIATPARRSARPARPGARRRRRSRERARSRRPPRGDVGAPAAELRDLALPLAQDRLAEDAERLVAIREADLADAEAGRPGEQQRRESRRRHAPHLERDRGAALAHTQHRGVAIADRPQPGLGNGRGLAQEARAGSGEVAVELETTHERAVHGQRDV